MVTDVNSENARSRMEASSAEDACVWGHRKMSKLTLPEDGNVMPKHVGATIHN